MDLSAIEACFDAHQKTWEATRFLIPVVARMAEVCAEAIKQGHKILICGMGEVQRMPSILLRNLWDGSIENEFRCRPLR